MMTPIAKKSDEKVYGILQRISGAMYPGVPLDSNFNGRFDDFSTFAIPKSVNLTYPVS